MFTERRSCDNQIQIRTLSSRGSSAGVRAIQSTMTFRPLTRRRVGTRSAAWHLNDSDSNSCPPSDSMGPLMTSEIASESKLRHALESAREKWPSVFRHAPTHPESRRTRCRWASVTCSCAPRRSPSSSSTWCVRLYEDQDRCVDAAADRPRPTLRYLPRHRTRRRSRVP